MANFSAMHQDSPIVRRRAAIGLRAGLASFRFEQLPTVGPKTRNSQLRGENGHAADSSRNAGREVILWVDTFNNYFHPETSRAALEVLQRAGFTVRIPRSHLCCGRPLYDFGMIDRAKSYLRRIMQILGKQIDAGLPIVVLEPSCASVFRDELQNCFLPKSVLRGCGARRSCSANSWKIMYPDIIPELSGKVLLHGHCHHKALMKMNDEESLLRKMGSDLQSLDSGCCGMAGPFGFERDKFALSQAVGERVLLPAVRSAARDTLIVSDGFSCREQIYQATGRKAVHLAEALRIALDREALSGDALQR